MTPATLAACLGKALARFEESWGSSFAWQDPVDIEALGVLLHAELKLVVDRQAIEKCRELIKEWEAKR